MKQIDWQTPTDRNQEREREREDRKNVGYTTVKQCAEEVNVSNRHTIKANKMAESYILFWKRYNGCYVA